MNFSSPFSFPVVTNDFLGNTFRWSLVNIVHGCRWNDVISVLVSILVLVICKYSHDQQRLPPGPPRYPLIGSLLSMPREYEWVKFQKWQKQYGDIIHISPMGRNLIVLNSYDSCVELLDKRAKIYSDRPRLVMAGELMGWEEMMGLLPYGPRHRRIRQLILQSLSPKAWSVPQREATRFLIRLLKAPESFLLHIKHAAGATALRLGYGYDVVDYNNDPYVRVVEKAMEDLSVATTPGAFLVDFIPWLRYLPAWFPTAAFQRQAKEWRKDLYDMNYIPFEFTKAQLAHGLVIPSLTADNLRKAKSEAEEDIVRLAASSLFAGGSDTTASATISFFLAMSLYPEVQLRAQEELDRVVGTNKLPTLSDRQRLPYIEAVMKEVYRWIPVAPLGMGHTLSQDDEYQSYRIPAGSTVFSNIWAMTHNEKYFPDPEAFRPERYLSENASNDPAADPLRLVFGFGKRACPGQRLSEVTTFLTIAMTLATFNIAKARDTITKEIIEPEVGVIPGFIMRPKDFSCSITPRSPKVVELIKAFT